MSPSKTRLAVAASTCALSFGVAAAPAAAGPDQITFGSLVAALNNVNVEIDNLEALNDLTVNDVRVVDVDDVANNNRALNNALNNNQVEINVLQDFLNDVDVDIQDVLNDLDVDIDDVIAIDVLSGGDVVVFVD